MMLVAYYIKTTMNTSENKTSKKQRTKKSIENLRMLWTWAPLLWKNG